ncbi:MAG: matrixin family metalloprotease [Candidatus Diapherotrites archaeon]|nr:matrixin family metalloprotease [Candidatus Diapherotrites archaeon]
MDKRMAFAILVSFLILAPMAFAAVQAKEPLEKITIIHYKKGFEKSQALPGKAQPVSCTKYIGNGLKWQALPINLVINPTNRHGLSNAFVSDTIKASAKSWDDATHSALFGLYSLDNTANWDDKSPDGRNELSFGNYQQSGVIAITNIWGYFSGKNKRITEFDIMFDTDFAWGNASLNPALMDLQNIATHEIGHGLGLSDLYTASCTLQTMYGYSTEGETIKRTLESGDIKGLQTLYGS